MELTEFLRKIDMLPEAARKVCELAASGRITEKEYTENKWLFQENREMFYTHILENKDFRLLFLYYFCRMGAEKYEEYNQMGLGDEVFRDTFYDLTLWCENCFREYGEYGLNEYGWFFRHLDLTIFRLGRLEFEKLPSPWTFFQKEKRWKRGIS